MLNLHTCTKVGLAASTQDGIKLRLISSDLIFSSGVQFLLPMQTDKKKKEQRTWTGLIITFHQCYKHQTNFKPVPEHPVWPGKCQQSPFRHGFPTQSKTCFAHYTYVMWVDTFWQYFKFPGGEISRMNQVWNMQELPDRGRPGVCGSDQRCHRWWRPPGSSRTLERKALFFF